MLKFKREGTDLCADTFIVCNFYPQGKIQKHQTFEAEIAAHTNSIKSLKSTGKQMISEGHFASDQIRVSVSPKHPVAKRIKDIIFGILLLETFV